MQGVSVPPGPDPPNLLPDVITLLPEVRYDGTYPGYAFGDVIAQPYPLAYNGETVYAKFVSITTNFGKCTINCINNVI